MPTAVIMLILNSGSLMNVGFEKVFLKAGESKTVSFKITPELLRFYDYDLNHVAEPGDFDVMIGGSSQAEKTARLTLK